MLALLSALVAVACVLASARRLAWAVAPTSLDAAVLLQALRGRQSRRRCRRFGRRSCSRDDLGWERDLFARARRAGRAVPRRPRRRAAARARLGGPAMGAGPAGVRQHRHERGFPLRIAGSPARARAAGGRGRRAGARARRSIAALNALAVGIAGTAFCVAVHVRARRVVSERVAAAERLVEPCADSPAKPPASRPSVASQAGSCRCIRMDSRAFPDASASCTLTWRARELRVTRHV